MSGNDMHNAVDYSSVEGVVAAIKQFMPNEQKSHDNVHLISDILNKGLQQHPESEKLKRIKNWVSLLIETDNQLKYESHNTDNNTNSIKQRRKTRRNNVVRLREEKAYERQYQRLLEALNDKHDWKKQHTTNPMKALPEKVRVPDGKLASWQKPKLNNHQKATLEKARERDQKKISNFFEERKGYHLSRASQPSNLPSLKVLQPPPPRRPHTSANSRKVKHMTFANIDRNKPRNRSNSAKNIQQIRSLTSDLKKLNELPELMQILVGIVKSLAAPQ